MKYKFKIAILKIQEYNMRLVRSKTFLYAICVILLGLVITTFSVKNKKIVQEDFRKNDILEARAAERLFVEDTSISMSEINRIAKLLNFFFNDIIVTKKYEIEGISEYYEDINEYDLQILTASKAGKTYEVSVIIALLDENSQEHVFVPYKEYEVIITSTNSGMKVEYINIIKD